MAIGYVNAAIGVIIVTIDIKVPIIPYASGPYNRVIIGYKIKLRDSRAKNLIAMVTGYETNSKATDYQDLIISGICSKNVI